MVEAKEQNEKEKFLRSAIQRKSNISNLNKDPNIQIFKHPKIQISKYPNILKKENSARSIITDKGNQTVSYRAITSSPTSNFPTSKLEKVGIPKQLTVPQISIMAPVKYTPPPTPSPPASCYAMSDDEEDEYNTIAQAASSRGVKLLFSKSKVR